MSGKKHQWIEYYSPRNGRISIQACQECGIIKSVALNMSRCSGVANSKKASLLREWTTNKPSKNVEAHRIR